MDNNDQLQLVYSNTSDYHINMVIENSQELPTVDFTLNDTPQDHFMYLLDLAIEYGDINYIKHAIKEYTNILDNTYIIGANNIMMQIIQEQVEEMVL